MNHFIVIALGGALGAVMRFMLTTSIYQWLGRDFPYGTLVVNLLGSFLIGLLAEALVLQRITLSMEYRSAILVGLLGSLTTFSTFSLDTLYLLEQGNLQKAILNALISVCAGVFAAWVGLLIGRCLFVYSSGVVRFMGWVFPYALVLVNVMGAFLIGLFCVVLLDKADISIEYGIAIVVILAGGFVTFSSLYVLLYLLEHKHSFVTECNTLLSVFAGNTLLCLATLWMGMRVGKYF